jgi:hypothetical protein
VLAPVLAWIAAQAPVFIDAGQLTPSLRGELEAEIESRTATAPQGAAYLVGVRQSPQILAVRITNAEGAPLVEREVSLSDGLRPALRVVVLLVAEAMSGSGDLPDEEPARIDRAGDPGGLELRLLLLSDLSVSRLALGGRAGVEVDLGGLRLGLTAGGQHWGARVEGTDYQPAYVGGLPLIDLTGALPLLAVGPVELSVDAGAQVASLTLRRVQLRREAFAGRGDPVPTTATFWEVALHGGLRAEVALSPRLALRLSGGVQFVPYQAAFLPPQDPAVYPELGPLVTPAIAERAELGVVWRLP